MAQPYLRIDRTKVGTLITVYAGLSRGHRRIETAFISNPTKAEERTAIEAALLNARERVGRVGMLSEPHDG